MKILAICGISLAVGLGTGLQAATFTASFAGDVCAIEPALDEVGESDCSFIEQPGSAKGVFQLALDGLETSISGDARITISSSFADLFQSDEQIERNGGGRDNPNEYFGLYLDSLFLGLLFDGDSSDEAAISNDLAESVLNNIADADRSGVPVELSFSLSESTFAPLISDGSLVAIFDFSFGLDDASGFNVNNFRDPQITVEYETEPTPAPVPVPATFGLMLMATGGLVLVRRRK